MDHVLETIGNTVTVTTRLKGTSPTQVKNYLVRENLPRICLLLVDADEVNRASLLEELQYKDLFKTVLDRVGKLPWGNSWSYSREFLLGVCSMLVPGSSNPGPLPFLAP